MREFPLLCNCSTWHAASYALVSPLGSQTACCMAAGRLGNVPCIGHAGRESINRVRACMSEKAAAPGEQCCQAPTRSKSLRLAGVTVLTRASGRLSSGSCCVWSSCTTHTLAFDGRLLTAGSVLV